MVIDGPAGGFLGLAGLEGTGTVCYAPRGRCVRIERVITRQLLTSSVDFGILIGTQSSEIAVMASEYTSELQGAKFFNLRHRNGRKKLERTPKESWARLALRYRTTTPTKTTILERGVFPLH
jgi:hypothetical protein